MDTSKYYPDLKAFSLAKLKNLFETTRLLPSQQLLKEKIEERFAQLEQQGIENLEQLQKALKTPALVKSYAQTSGVPADYLTLLRREVNSYLPQPVDLKEFPGVNPDVVQKLQTLGIKNTQQLFPYVLTPASRSEFAAQHQISPEELLELTRLTDVVRIKWVGPKFARLLTASSYNTLEKIARSNHEELYKDLIRVNEELGIYQGRFGIEDMNSWVNVAVQQVPQVIQY